MDKGNLNQLNLPQHKPEAVRVGQGACTLLTFASNETAGLAGNSTSVALRMVFSSRIVACDWL